MKIFPWLLFLILFYLSFTPIIVNAQTAQLQNGFSLHEPVLKNIFDINYSDSVQSHFAIKINPLQWLWDDIRIGFEYPLFRKVSLELKIGIKSSSLNLCEEKYKYSFYNDSTGLNEVLKYNSTGFNIGLATNIYFNNSLYLQLFLFYKRYKYIFADEYQWYSGPYSYIPEYNNERADYNKSVIGFELLFGKVFCKNKFLIDIYSGIGIRYKWRELMGNNYDWIYGVPDFHRSKKMVLPTAHLGVNIGWTFKKTKKQ
ncbi:MAG: hypothetical protein A2W93_09820 [Bacteroidetes bacterium GWF2_43_63]|nr:MAG: hypothetical protein A2W94_00095 [Bacteroidetes bacterium GWE2_42_42]OFY56152.1 MAG: hypothetical protein A2W93_09820 [Bacteroidetes bacterium GWF2_43_63]HBG69754.1 hypothetical protein [Bacteroidales bacterium]HCB61130.1 hypothetical protein [Bacteroidales bacterium]HCY24074.1 hypothetical protein [Bacteroidales bacterium]